MSVARRDLLGLYTKEIYIDKSIVDNIWEQVGCLDQQPGELVKKKKGKAFGPHLG